MDPEKTTGYSFWAFDLAGGRTYDTRPMRDDRQRHTVDTLVTSGVRQEFSIPLAELPRLAESLADRAGAAAGVVSFERAMGLAMADITLKAEPQLVCQRCMQPMPWPIDSRSRIALVTDLAAADRLPEGIESMIVENDRVSVRDLVEEELLLALPIVPKCEAGDACSRMKSVPTSVAETVRDEAAPPSVQTPFAQLGELLKRGK
jgi:uncharacterized protein